MWFQIVDPELVQPLHHLPMHFTNGFLPPFMNRSTPWVILDVISSSGSHWLVFKAIGCVLFYWLHSSQSPRLLLRTFFSSLPTTWVDFFELLNWGCLSHKLVWSVGLLLVCLWLRGNWALPSWHKGRFNCWPVLPTTTHRPETFLLRRCPLCTVGRAQFPYSIKFTLRPLIL